MNVAISISHFASQKIISRRLAIIYGTSSRITTNANKFLLKRLNFPAIISPRQVYTIRVFSYPPLRALRRHVFIHRLRRLVFKSVRSIIRLINCYCCWSCKVKKLPPTSWHRQYFSSLYFSFFFHSHDNKYIRKSFFIIGFLLLRSTAVTAFSVPDFTAGRME